MSELSPDQYQDYKEDVFDYVFTDQKPVAQPKAFILAGQPGAGKGGLKKAVKEFFEDTGESFVVVDPDDFRDLHPKYEQYNLEDDTTSAARTHPDASQVSDEVREKAISEKYNLIIDGTLKNASKALALVQNLKENGYEIHVRAICVPPSESWTGCLKRYERDKKTLGSGRYVPRHIHDEAVNAMVFSLVEIERQGFADTLTVQNREGTIHHKSAPLQNDPPAKEEAVRNVVGAYVEHGARPQNTFEELLEIKNARRSVSLKVLFEDIVDVIKRIFR